MPAPPNKAVEQSQAQAREPMSFVTSVSGTVIISGKTGPASLVLMISLSCDA
jgi:hypothetical protein